MSIAPRPLAARRRAVALVLAGTIALVLAACHQAPPPPSNTTPEKALATNLRLTATGDFDGLMKNRLPPADYVVWRQAWDKQHAHPVPASVAQQQQFARIMQMLTEPGAEAKLAKRLAPELKRLHGGKGEPMPIFGSILEASVKQMIDGSPQLGPAQRTFATQALGAITAWAQTVDFSNAKQAQKAIALVCTTARALHVQTLAQWRALDYATTMKNYGILWNGLEDLMDLYGLDLAGSLNNAKITAIAVGTAQAEVRVDLKLAGKSLSGQWPMVKQDNHWYDATLLEAWQKTHPAPAPSGSTAPVAAITAAVASTTTLASPPAASSGQPAPASSGTRKR